MAYCTRADIEAIFGPSNVATWADLDNDKVAADIASRIASAITYADASIDSRLLGGPYKIPFVAVGSVIIPLVIQNLSARIAGVHLYENRGVFEVNPVTGGPIHKLMTHKKEVSKVLGAIKRGSIRFGDRVKTQRVVVPQVVAM